MKSYIFLTKEGHTIAPNENIEVNNMQVIGIIENAANEDAALIQLLKENPWIIEAEFNVGEFISYQIL